MKKTNELEGIGNLTRFIHRIIERELSIKDRELVDVRVDKDVKQLLNWHNKHCVELLEKVEEASDEHLKYYEDPAGDFSDAINNLKQQYEPSNTK